MEELQNTVNYIKSLVDEKTLNVIDFLEKSNILNYSIKMDKIKDGDKVVEKPSNRINIDFLKICSQDGFPQNEDFPPEKKTHFGYITLYPQPAFFGTIFSSTEELKCRMINAELWCPLCGRISIISEGNTFILHSSICIERGDSPQGGNCPCCEWRSRCF